MRSTAARGAEALAFPVLLWLAAACAPERPGSVGGLATSGSAGGGTATAGATGPGGGTADAPRLDVGEGAGGGGLCGDPDVECGCNAVDLLFVVDNSVSMKPHQKALAAAFPGFVDAMWTALPEGTSLHVGVTTTSLHPGCCPEKTFTDCTSEYDEDWLGTHCYDAALPDVLDTGENGGQGRLYVHGGQSYFQAVVGVDDPGPLSSWFTAVADQTGELGACVEMPAAAAGLVTHPANAATNAGFLRDSGAALVVFVVTDEPDKSPEPVDTYIDMLAGAKESCGGIDCIRAAGFVPESCYEAATDKTLRSFLEGFGEAPLVAGIAKQEGQPPPDYSGLVGDALAALVAEQCAEIPPEG